MLNRDEIQQVRLTVLAQMAELEEAMHRDHGSYTHLCAVDGVTFYAHSPVGQVLHQFDATITQPEVPAL